MHSLIRTAAVAVVAALASACGREASSAIAVERTDSAGVEIVTSGGTDVPLAWSFEPVLTLGGAEDGPEAFYQVRGGLGSDGAGNVYVLDRGNHRVLVFGADGRHLRTMGRKGGGPGEMEFPGSLTVEADGSVGVQDPMLRRMVRFAPDGSVVAPIAFTGSAMIEDASMVGGIPVLLSRAFDPETGSVQELVIAAEGDTTVLARVETPPGKGGRFPNCAVQIPGLPPIFSPAISWTAVDDRLALSAGAAYEVRIVEGGRHLRTLRRDVAPAPATAQLAEGMVPRGEMHIRFGSGECRIPARDVVEARGFAPLVPAISRIALAPDGSTWVARSVPGEDRPPVDVFAPDGAYRGTLPTGTPFPDAFLPDGRILRVEEDELEVERVVAYRVAPSAD